MCDITDGTSNTYLIGEKYLTSDYYANGHDHADNESMYKATTTTATARRTTTAKNSDHQPMQDTPGYQDALRFGSAHAVSFNTAMCDGLVRAINYSIDPETHRRLGNRKDGLHRRKEGVGKRSGAASRRIGRLHILRVGFQHFGQQFHRQADDVRLAAFEDVDPIEAVLVAEGPGLAVPLAAGDVVVHLLGPERVHSQPSDGHADRRLAIGELPQAKPAQDPCSPAEDFSIARASSSSAGLPRIRPPHSATVSQPRTSPGDAAGDVRRFLAGEPGHQFRGASRCRRRTRPTRTARRPEP